MLGEAGIGKSVLVRKIAAEASRLGDWVTPQIRVPSGVDALRAVAKAVLELSQAANLPVSRSKQLRELVNRVRAVSAYGISLTVDKSPGLEPYAALTELLTEIGKAAARKGKCVLIHIDEVQNITDHHQLSQLLISLGDVISLQYEVAGPNKTTISRTLPVMVYLTGLPEFADTVGSSAGATFSRRFQTFTLAPMAADSYQLALRPLVISGLPSATTGGAAARAKGHGTVSIAPDAADKVIELSGGDPYLFQLAGERAWYAGSGHVVTVEHVISGWRTLRGEATRHVEKILERLPERERELLAAMAKLPPEQRSATAVAKQAGYSDASDIGSAASRLELSRGIIHRGKPYGFTHRAIEAYFTADWPNVD